MVEVYCEVIIGYNPRYGQLIRFGKDGPAAGGRGDAERVDRMVVQVLASNVTTA